MRHRNWGKFTEPQGRDWIGMLMLPRILQVQGAFSVKAGCLCQSSIPVGGLSDVKVPPSKAGPRRAELSFFNAMSLFGPRDSMSGGLLLFSLTGDA